MMQRIKETQKPPIKNIRDFCNYVCDKYCSFSWFTRQLIENYFEISPENDTVWLQLHSFMTSFMWLARSSAPSSSCFVILTVFNGATFVLELIIWHEILVAFNTRWNTTAEYTLWLAISITEAENLKFFVSIEGTFQPPINVDKFYRSPVAIWASLLVVW